MSEREISQPVISKNSESGIAQTVSEIWGRLTGTEQYKPTNLKDKAVSNLPDMEITMGSDKKGISKIDNADAVVQKKLDAYNQEKFGMKDADTDGGTKTALKDDKTDGGTKSALKDANTDGGTKSALKDANTDGGTKSALKDANTDGGTKSALKLNDADGVSKSDDKAYASKLNAKTYAYSSKDQSYGQ